MDKDITENTDDVYVHEGPWVLPWQNVDFRTHFKFRGILGAKVMRRLVKVRAFLYFLDER